jgi:hypothetical protein
MKQKSLTLPEKWILLGIPVLFLIGSVFHSLYEASGESPIVGAIAPVNESVWEHQKMALVPVILWWTIYYLIKGNQYKIDSRKWFTGMVVSLVSSILTIPLIYYFYTGAFGVDVLIIDILILLLADTIGQLLGLHFYRYSKGLPVILSILVASIILAVFIVFTFNTPKLPWFRDSITGQYGI